jgi:hypothetical protein
MAQLPGPQASGDKAWPTSSARIWFFLGCHSAAIAGKYAGSESDGARRSKAPAVRSALSEPTRAASWAGRSDGLSHRLDKVREQREAEPAPDDVEAS